MKRNTNKKILSGAMALLMVSSMAFADSYTNQETKINGISYLPVRKVMESYGYEVIWNPQIKGVELLKGAGYNAYYVESNSFVRNKMAPMPLEHKILVKDGRMYISTKDLKENMNLEELDKDPANDVVKITGLIIDSIGEDGVIKCLQGQEEAFVYVNNAKVSHYGQEGDYKITKDDIGKEILLTNPPYMTAIYPAQYRAIAVEVLPKDTSVTTGSITAVDLGERKSILISKEGYVDVLVLVGPDTIIENAKGEKISLGDVKMGKEITAYHSIAMTMSIPGQTNGYRLIVEQ